MTRRFRKKRTLALAALLLLLLTAAGAYAYFTTTGAGSGSATVGTSSAITLSATTTGNLYPGSSVPVTLTANNPSSGDQYVTSVTLSGIKACYNATGTSTWNGTSCSNSGSEVTTCEDYSAAAVDPNNTDFWMAPVSEGVQLAPNSSGDTLTGGTLTMNDLNSSQNQCKSANLYLTFTSS
jgi:hypothetical protein